MAHQLCGSSLAVTNEGEQEMMPTLSTQNLRSATLRVLFIFGIGLILVFGIAESTQANSLSPSEDPVNNSLYLPVVLNNFPFIPDAPVLEPIDNQDGDGYYDISWSTSEGAISYTLQEAKQSDFSDAVTVYSGAGTIAYIGGKAVGTYYYRVQAASADTVSVWSNVQQAVVLPPMSEVYVENNTGGQLCYTVEDTGIGQKCFSGGTHYYGSFPAGTYSWRASASCGTDSGTEDYEAGIFTHEFWCN
jgi:hypothetical protein